MPVRYTNPEGLAAPIGQYSHVATAVVHRLVLVAGETGMRADGDVPSSFGEQAEGTFRNLGIALASEGLSFADVLHLTTFIVGRENLEAFAEARRGVYAEHYPDGSFPPNTLVFVSGLARPELLIEIQAIAATMTETGF
jgi:2-iminobutanoate/2-iminopropanoate deaminase